MTSRLSVRGRGVGFLAIFLLTFAVLAVGAGPALAKDVHFFSSSFGEPCGVGEVPCGPGKFSAPAGVAVNISTSLTEAGAGDVYVVDSGDNRVERFSAMGAYLGQFNGGGEFEVVEGGTTKHEMGTAAPTGAFGETEWVAVDDAGGLEPRDVYVADNGPGVVDRFTPMGEYLGQLTGRCEIPGEAAPCAGSALISFGNNFHGVAVDPAGNLWVYEGSDRVDEFSDTGITLGSYETGRGAQRGLAVDSSDDAFVACCSNRVGKFSSTGVELHVYEGIAEDVDAVAVAPSSDDLYIDHGSGIEEYGPFGEPYEGAEPKPSFPSEGLSNSGGVAVDGQGTVYATQGTADNVEIFPEATLAEVEVVEPVSHLTPTSVTLNGTVDPEETVVTGCDFEYGTEAGSYPFKQACSPEVSVSEPLTGNAPVPVSANVSGLLPDTAYHYRIAARNPDRSETSDHEFLTAGAGISEERVTSVEATAATLQAKIDPNGSPTTYHFEYDTAPYTSSASHGTGTQEGSIEAGASAVAVSIRLAGLTPGGTYYYRVVAVSELAPGERVTIDGPGKALATPGPAGGTPTEGCPNAKPRAEQPYGATLPDCRAYEMVSPLDKSGAAVGSTDSRAAVSGEALTYTSVGSFQGSGPEPAGAAVVSRYLSRRGPDGWSTANITPPYHTFSPQTKTAFQELLFTPELSAGILESRFTPLVKGDQPGYMNLYLADTENGTYQRVSDITPPEAEIPPYVNTANEPERPEAAGASTDLSHVVFQQKASLLGASPDHEHVYEWAGGPLSQVDVPPEGIKFEGEDSVGAPGAGSELASQGNPWRAVSADGSRVFFTAGEKQYPSEIQPGVGQLYVRENPGAPQSPYARGSCSAPEDACTVEVSASQRTNPVTGEPEPDPHGPRPAFYRGASVNGGRVFFTSRAELTNDAHTGPEDNAANLYEYDLETGVLSDLSVPAPSEEAQDPEGAAVLGLATASEDGSYVYFVANGVLSQTANSEGAKAAPGNCKEEEGENLVGERTCSLYVEHHDGSGWEPPVFIARLIGGDKPEAGVSTARDESDWLGYEYSVQHGVPSGVLREDWGPGQHRVRVGGGGASLAFESQRSLTGYDNEQAEAGECREGESGRCREVYVYDVGSGSHPATLVCASCDPLGVRPVGPAELGAQEGSLEAHSLNEVSPFYVQGNLSEGGGRLFFQSPDALVPSDSNGRQDVYEWERVATAAEVVKGENSCTLSSPDYHAGEEGCVFPVSDVAGDYDSSFMDASPSGNDVFIATTDQLLPSDTDFRADAYDVRVGGGFPVSVASAVCSNADSCKAPESPQPGVFGAPASATFSGPGDPATSPPSPPAMEKVAKKMVKCSKGKVREHGKCVKRRRSTRAKKATGGRK